MCELFTFQFRTLSSTGVYDKVTTHKLTTAQPYLLYSSWSRSLSSQITDKHIHIHTNPLVWSTEYITLQFGLDLEITGSKGMMARWRDLTQNIVNPQKGTCYSTKSCFYSFQMRCGNLLSPAEILSMYQMLPDGSFAPKVFKETILFLWFQTSLTLTLKQAL